MAEKETGKTRASRPAQTTPEDFPVSSTSYPSGDYSYVLEIVMRMQESVGRMTEAITSLKEQSRSHSDKLEGIGKDVHAAKVVIAVVGGLIAVIGAFIGWTINTYLSTHPVK